MGASPAQLGYRWPAEWEPHDATWIAWPERPRDWPGKSGAIRWVIGEMARLLSEHETVKVIVADARARQHARHVLVRAGANPARITFFRSATDRTWMRDCLPLFVVRDGKRRRRLGGVKWRFDGWARWKPFARDEAAGRRVAEAVCSRTWYPRATFAGRSRRIVLEGGAIDTDGAGTAMVTEQCLLGNRHGRNPGLGREGTERALREYLGIRRLLWLPRGLTGDDTNGHVDVIARFVARGVVALCREPDRNDANHRILAEACERLTGARDARGRRLEIVVLPMPAPVYDGGVRLAASYANFLIANGKVLVPTFDDPADRTALGRISDLFPDRVVVGVHARDLVLGGGAIHCSTMSQPVASP